MVTPLLLPWLPGRAFSVKGLCCAFAAGIPVLTALVFPGFSGDLPHNAGTWAGWLFICGAVGSFMALNYTGTSTLTSLSGVKKETRRALPFQGVGLVVGMRLWILGSAT